MHLTFLVILAEMLQILYIIIDMPSWYFSDFYFNIVFIDLMFRAYTAGSFAKAKCL